MKIIELLNKNKFDALTRKWVLSLPIAFALAATILLVINGTANFREKSEQRIIGRIWETYQLEGADLAIRAAEESGNKTASNYFQWRKIFYGEGTNDERYNYALTHLSWPGMRDIALQSILQGKVALNAQERLNRFSQLDDGSISLQLAKFEAIKELQLANTLRQEVSQFWRAGAILSHDAQTKFISDYGDQLSEHDHLERFHAILGKTGTSHQGPSLDMISSAEYLTNFISIEVMSLLRAWASGSEEDRANINESWSSHAAIIAQDAWALQNNKPLDAIKLFLSINPDTADPKSLWRLRRVLIRNSVREGAYAEGYELAINHGLGNTTEGFVGELLAGWIALKYLNAPELALQHYNYTAENASGPWITSKALRGKGRALADLDRLNESERVFRECASYKTTFYALLCLEDLDMPLRAENATEGNLSENFEQFLAVTEFLILAERPEQDILPFARLIFTQASHQNDLIAASAALTDREDLIFTRTKGVMNSSGTQYFHASAMPQPFKTLAESQIEPALTHAIVAQESQFRTSVTSSAGAQGLMQIMPETGQEIAIKLGLDWDKGKLVDPQFNLELGQAYMRNLLERYDFSHLVALAAYNAGPGNADRWIEDFGDPSSGEIAPEDWIDALTIAETRIYVQRVLTNLYLYRIALSKDKSIEIDLQRAMIGYD